MLLMKININTLTKIDISETVIIVLPQPQIQQVVDIPYSLISIRRKHPPPTIYGIE